MVSASRRPKGAWPASGDYARLAQVLTEHGCEVVVCCRGSRGMGHEGDINPGADVGQPATPSFAQPPLDAITHHCPFVYPFADYEGNPRRTIIRAQAHYGHHQFVAKSGSLIEQLVEVALPAEGGIRKPALRMW